MIRVGVLASGNGSNFQALVDNLNVDGSPARVVSLISNVETAKVIDRARKANIDSSFVDPKEASSRQAYDEIIAAKLVRQNIDLVCLAGYMRIVSPAFLKHFPNRVINIHPALLPSFPGLHGVRQALAAGVRISGCTVHFVDEGTDTGPIIAQARVRVRGDDTVDSLRARIQAAEHELLPAVVRSLL